MNAVILVGGQGTRLRPLTYTTCKAMVPVLNKPFLAHVFSYLKRYGVTNIVLSVGYMPDQIRAYFGDGSSLGLRLTYVVEDSPLGTAGGVKNAERYLDGPTVVMNGDIFTDIDLGAMVSFHKKRGAKVTIALTGVEDPSQYGVVETDAKGQVRRFLEKPAPGETTSNLINAGIYILEPEVLREVPANTRSMFERDLFPKLIQEGTPVYGYPSDAYWMDMGTPGKYLTLQCDLLDGKCAINLPADAVVQKRVLSSDRSDQTVMLGSDCAIGHGVHLNGPTVLGSGCRVEDGAVLERSVLWSNVVVGRGAKISNCIIGEDCIIGDGCTLPEGTVLADHTVVGQHVAGLPISASQDGV
jgi:mannose-1-phosphate guanylyltransferase